MTAIHAPHLARCYEVAGKKIAADRTGTLIHGIIRNDIGDASHAWVELPGGNVYEPTTDTEYGTPEFRVFFQPYELARYTTREALRHICDEGNWGPWDNSSLVWFDRYHEQGVDHQQASKVATEHVIGMKETG